MNTMTERKDVNDCLRIVAELFNKYQEYHSPVVVPSNYQIVFYEDEKMALLAENNSNHPIATSFDSELFSILRSLAREGPGVAKTYKSIVYFFRRGSDGILP